MRLDISVSSTALAGIGLAALLLCQAAAADPVWQTFGTSVSATNAPKYVAALDKLMSSPIGQQSPGRLILQANVADGDDPSTHTVVPVFGSAAEREAYFQKLTEDPAFAEFQATVEKIAQPQSSTRYSVIKSWGDISDADIVWTTISFDVTDPPAFLKAMETFLATPTGQKLTGQVYLSAVTAGGITPVSHVITVGWKSDAEAEVWTTSLRGNADWAAQLKTMGKISQRLGASNARTIKAWGKSLKDALAP